MADKLNEDYFVYLDLLRIIVSNSRKTQIALKSSSGRRHNKSTEVSNESNDDRFDEAARAIFGLKVEREKPGPRDREGEDIKIRRMLLAEATEGKELEIKELIRTYAPEIFEEDYRNGIKTESTIDRLRPKIKDYRENYIILHEISAVKKSEFSESSMKELEENTASQIEPIIRFIATKAISGQFDDLLQKYGLKRTD